MRQLLNNLKTGEITLIDAPAPEVTMGTLLIESRVSLISSGTERMLVDFGRSSYMQKARQQPEKVKQVIEKLQTDGVATTIEAVNSKLNQLLPMGYSNVGVVLAVGENVSGYEIGDRVVSNGPHAEVVRVPQNLCARIPDNVTDLEASFTVCASIGLQGIRLAQPTLGESVAVIGTGLIGLLTIQLLIAQGCSVLAIDFDSEKLAIATKLGASTCDLSQGAEAVAAGMAFSEGRGIDAVIVTASAKSSDPISTAAKMSRHRGRIVLVGVTGLELNRAEFYEKELTFQVSCSYGPGRYDSEYEERGVDYPIGHVRWTEQRNFTAVLKQMAANKLKAGLLLSHTFDFEDAPNAYESLLSEKGQLGIALSYACESSDQQRVKAPPVTHIVVGENNIRFDSNEVVLGCIGAGNYASRVLIPAFSKTGARLHTLVTSGGLNSSIQARQASFHAASSNVNDIFSNTEINTVAIATRHDSHADLSYRALDAGKHVFVEKPLAIKSEELRTIESLYETGKVSSLLMVGFNRRFSPHTVKMKELIDSLTEPLAIVMTVNAGFIPLDHWTQDRNIGGGRIVGEACHFIDLARFLVGRRASKVSATKLAKTKHANSCEDSASITLRFEDGSIATIHYLANGSNSFQKERIEVFSEQKILQLNNFKKLEGFGWSQFRKLKTLRQEKGQNECCREFHTAIVESGAPPIPINELLEVHELCFEARKQLEAGT